MKKALKIVIEASSDFFDGYVENLEGIYGAGNTIEACKADIISSLEEMRHTQPTNLPQWVIDGDYVIEYHFDTRSLMAYFSGIVSQKAIAERAGINPKQLQHYASGISKPREQQHHRIVTAYRELGQEMMSVTV